MSILAAFVLLAASGGPPPPRPSASPETVAWFQATEQQLMNAVAPGDKGPWERVMAPECAFTTEEGQVMSREQFLADLRPLPDGLRGAIAVRDLTVEDLPGLAVVRYRADEWEEVFGQRLETAYRTTDTFVHKGSQWKLVASHTSVVTRDPPAQIVESAGWGALAGRYRLLPEGWTFSVELRDGALFGGRDPKVLRPLIPLAPNVFVLSGSLGEWIFVLDETGRATRIVDFRKFETLIWTRVEG